MRDYRQWWTARDLAAERLPGLPHSRTNISRYFSRGLAVTPFLFRTAHARGGGWKIHIDGLPPRARAELLRRALVRAQSGDAPQPCASGQLALALARNHEEPSASLTDGQSRARAARLTVLREIERRAHWRNQGVTKAVASFLADYQGDRLKPAIAEAARAANAKGRGLSRSTLFIWMRARKNGDNALTPTPTRRKAPLPEWLNEFLKIYAIDSKSTISKAYAKWKNDRPCENLPLIYPCAARCEK